MNTYENYNFDSHFQELFEKLSEFFSEKSYSIDKKGENIKAHQVYSFDIEVNNIIIDYLTQSIKIPMRIISEESEEVVIGEKEPELTFVIDPVDGSVNVNRGLNIFSFGIAILQGTEQLSVNFVIASMVGNLLTNEYYVARKGCGSYCNNEAIHASKRTDPKTFMFNFELSHLIKKDFPQFFDIIPEIHQVRSLGSAITALSLVARGGIDAHIDIRNRLTIENILPASLLILEAGGIITDSRGNELKPTKNLKTPFNIIASGNRTIHSWILKKINV
ncbi:MAG: hypothetical protein HWN65_16335 [Candidatus Helarchaeota archaeon]|nr:hypothetical protein [Candidatus Helarchaeota archaeon]